jgi:hypothetical protein
MTFFHDLGIKVTILSVLGFGGGFSCMNEKQKPSQIESNTGVEISHLSLPNNINAGIIHEHIAINNDELNSFAIYLPKLYSPNISWPTVFYFDAGGKGVLPIKQYQSLADSLGYIFIGSNVSKNGQTIDETLIMWNALKNSCINHFSIDKDRIILAGFSGGARVCCTIASKEKSIHGIIANSGGSQDLEQILSQNSFFIGISGNGDMNRAEMLGIEQHLLSTVIPHFYIEFDGIHQWAPLGTMKKALTIATLQSYTKNPSLLNPDILSNFISNQQNEIEKLKSDNNLLDAYHQLFLLTKASMGLSSVPLENPDSIKNNPVYLAQKNELLKTNAEETEMQQLFYQLMISNPDTIKWKVKIEQVRKKSQNKSKIGQMNQRLLGYASLLCYSLSNRNLVSKNYALAEKMITCYRIADPKNAEVYYFKAILSGENKNKEKTIFYLKKAIDLGFQDKLRISNQIEFNFLKNEDTFRELLK